MGRVTDAAFIARLVARTVPLVRVSGLGECWEWTGAKNSRGYGQISYRGRVVYAHRISLELATGKALGGLYACHRCDNPVCIRPEHLFAATQKENLRDMAQKGRSAAGERSGRAKLTRGQVDDIRSRHAAGEDKHSLAACFAVHPEHISYLARGRGWRAI